MEHIEFVAYGFNIYDNGEDCVRIEQSHMDGKEDSIILNKAEIPILISVLEKIQE
mgnify:CR=1 FL=1